MTPSTVTLVTCTGDRPEAFALCERWMARQSVRWDQWVVLCDGQEPTRCTVPLQELSYWPELRGKPSMPRKLGRAIERELIRGDVVMFIEDDDWYAPDYVEAMAGPLAFHSVVGEGKAIYYNVAWRAWKCHGNMGHASFCQTVIRRSMLRMIGGLIARGGGDPFVDGQLWKERWTNSLVLDPEITGRRCIGIKSMPGRPGYGSGHTERRGTIPDPKLERLRDLIGADVQHYAPFYEKTHE